ncbi:3549_t:CDS:2, partial [Funneliformis geosporum]
IVQEVFGSLPEKTMEFEVFDISNIATPNKFSPVNSPSNNNNNNNTKVDDIPESSSLTKDSSKLLDPDEYLEDNDMEEDLKDFTVVTKAIPLQLLVILRVSVCHVNLMHSVIVYFTTSDVATTALPMTIPDLKIDTFCDFSQYKADMQFKERTIHVTDIPLQIKPANIKQVFAKYGTVTDFKMIVR